MKPKDHISKLKQHIAIAEKRLATHPEAAQLILAALRERVRYWEGIITIEKKRVA